VYRLSKKINVIAGIFLSGMVLLTVSDVILRSFRVPIIGAYELVAFSGVVVVGFSLPLTQWTKGHIAVDFLILKLPLNIRKWIIICTRIFSIIFLTNGTCPSDVLGDPLHRRAAAFKFDAAMTLKNYGGTFRPLMPGEG
jgi:hypothetical protein